MSWIPQEWNKQADEEVREASRKPLSWPKWNMLTNSLLAADGPGFFARLDLDRGTKHGHDGHVLAPPLDSRPGDGQQVTDVADTVALTVLGLAQFRVVRYCLTEKGTQQL